MRAATLAALFVVGLAAAAAAQPDVRPAAPTQDDARAARDNRTPSLIVVPEAQVADPTGHAAARRTLDLGFLLVVAVGMIFGAAAAWPRARSLPRLARAVRLGAGTLAGAASGLAAFLVALFHGIIFTWLQEPEHARAVLRNALLLLLVGWGIGLGTRALRRAAPPRPVAGR